MKSESVRTALEQSFGITNLGALHYNLNAPNLYEHAVFLEEGVISAHGALVVETTPFTGRAAQDKFIVEEPANKEKISWGEVNKPFDQVKFNTLKARVAAYLQGRDVYVRDCFVGSDSKYHLAVRVVTEHAWQSLFARNMFVEAEERDLARFEARFTVVCVPNFKAIPEIDGTRSEAFIIIDFSQRLVLIGGTKYAGEIKKAMFTVMNYLSPIKRVFPMHCSANVGAKTGDTALFFGLSGTGKTTLSADPERKLIGDDEHGWADEGIFNFEGGCYAKVIDIAPETEPIIYQMTRSFGTILENVKLDIQSRSINFSDASITENTRASYPRTSLTNTIIVPRNKGPHPRNVFFLTADAFGVLPPIAKLTPEQAMFHFLSGYTAKLAGTERGVKEPTATFSTCFGAPFMVLPPASYASMLKLRLQKNRTRVWLINTGWTGGEYGSGDNARRMTLEHTRALVAAVLNGALDNGEFVKEPFFNLSIPTSCPGIPAEILNPRAAWAKPEQYDVQAKRLHDLFVQNFEKNFAGIESVVLASIKFNPNTVEKADAQNTEARKNIPQKNDVQKNEIVEIGAQKNDGNKLEQPQLQGEQRSERRDNPRNNRRGGRPDNRPNRNISGETPITLVAKSPKQKPTEQAPLEGLGRNEPELFAATGLAKTTGTDKVAELPTVTGQVIAGKPTKAGGKGTDKRRPARRAPSKRPAKGGKAMDKKSPNSSADADSQA